MAESKRERFVRLAEARTNKILDMMKLLGNCSSKSNYEYTEEDVKKIISEIVAKNEDMVKERQMGAMGPLMGMSMKQLKGKADGSLVNKIVREEIQKLI